MNKRTPLRIAAVSATTLALAAVAAPAFAAPTSPAPGESVFGKQSDLTFTLPGGQSAADQKVATDYRYNFGAETATTTYHLPQGATLTVDVHGSPGRVDSVIVQTTGTATYVDQSGASTSYSVVGGDFTFNSNAGSAQPAFSEAVYFSQGNTGVSSMGGN